VFEEENGYTKKENGSWNSKILEHNHAVTATAALPIVGVTASKRGVFKWLWSIRHSKFVIIIQLLSLQQQWYLSMPMYAQGKMMFCR
jgi:hypothetical protein